MSDKSIDVIEELKLWIGRTLFIGCILEMIFFASEINFFGCVSSLYGWNIISRCCIRRDYLQNYPLPTIVMFGLAICYSVFPIIVTLVEGKPVSFNFQVPYLTYTNQILSVTVITVAYRIAINYYRPKCFLNKVWNKIGYMSIPSEPQIWIMGIIGLISLLIIMSQMGQEKEFQATGNFQSILIRIMSGLSLAPICLYFKDLYGDFSHSKTRRFVKYYIIVLMIIGLASTRRALIFNSVFTIACIYLFLMIYENRRIFSKKNAIIVVALAYLITGPLADISMAMILNRHFGGNASQTAGAVWKLYSDKENLHKIYQLTMAATDNDGDNSLGWSEYYVDNIFLDRFCNLRTIDATLYNAKKMGFGCNKGKEYYTEFWVKELPSPLADLFGLKKKYQGTAVDHMVINNFNDDRYNLNGFKVGGETGIGLWLFGYSYYIVSFFTYIIIFYFLCSFVNISSVGILFPLPVLISFSSYILFFTNANGIFTSMESVFARAHLDGIFIYCILFFFIRLLTPKRM